MDFTVITPTGDRPEPFALCKKYFQRQTIKPKEWLVIDDGKLPLEQDDLYRLIRREPTPQDRSHTLRVNIKTILPHVNTEAIIVMEDDDWYHPDYLQYMFNGLQKHDLFGQGNTIYYNVKNKTWMNNRNTGHCSFCQTGFTKKVIPCIDKLYEVEHAALDWDMWLAYNGNKCVEIIPQNYCIGIKGMNGRTGTHGHWWDMENKDHDLIDLKKFIGEDYKNYF